MTVNFSHASTARLTHHDLGRFEGDTLFARIGRAVCEAGCLPRKELYEAWEVARRTRRLFRGGRIVDLATGHGLLAHVMLLLDDTSPSAIAADPHLPPSASTLHDALRAHWPRLDGRIQLLAAGIEEIDLTAADVVVSAHACGALTDLVLARASAARARVAVLPCCHHLDSEDARRLAGWVDGSLAIDIARAQRLEQQGYRIWTQSIAPGITPKARLLLAKHGSDGCTRISRIKPTPNTDQTDQHG
ncbi:MAG: methyltransferase [Acidobacteriota bacterium]|nr:methyltransferase [Acidobacteriota bacterium]